MIENFVLFGHLAVGGVIIALVLLQRGKGAEAGTGFGAGASGTVFGARGSANFFSRATAVLATLFFATSLTLAYFATRVTGSDSLLEGSVFQGTSQEQTAPGITESLVPVDPDDAPPVLPGDEGDLPSLEEGSAPDSGDSN